MASVTDDIDTLGKLISQLLATVDTVAKKTTEEVPAATNQNHHQKQLQNGHDNLPQSQQPPISRIEALCEEVKQILRKHYVITAGTCEEERPAITCSTEGQGQWQQSTFLLSLLEGQISRSRSNHSNCSLDDVRLFRYHLIVALSYAVVGIANLLLSCETAFPSSSPVTEPPSLPTIVSGPSSASLSSADLESCNQPANVLSTKYEAVIRMATHYLLQTAFIGSLKHYFANAEQLFLSPVRIVNQQLLDSAPLDRVEVFLLKPVYFLYVNLILTQADQTLVSKYIRDSLFAPLMGCFVVYRLHNTKKSSVNCYDEQFRLADSSLTTKFNQYVAEPSNQMYAIRGLLVCTKAAPDKVTRALVAISLSKFISQPKGIEIILDAILDSDVSSEEETTIATRQEFIAKMITSIPLKADDVAVIHRAALKQSVCDLLLKEKVDESSKHSVEIYQRMGALIVQNIASVDGDFIKKALFDELTRVLSGHQTSDLISDIESAVVIVHQLLLHRVSVDLLQPMIAPLFYIRLAFEKKISPTRTVLDEALVEALKEIPESYYLLDAVVYGKMDSSIDRFEAKIDISGPELVYRIGVRSPEEKGEKLSTEETLERVQSLTTLTLSLLKAMTPNYRYNYLFILLDRLTEPAGTHSPLQSLVLLELLEQLNKGLLGATISKAQEDSREGLLFADPRTMRFLAITFQKVVEQLVSMRPPTEVAETGANDDGEEAEEALTSHWARSLQSLTFCIGALELFVMRHFSSQSATTSSGHQLSEDDQQRQGEVDEQLQSCCTTLATLLRCPHFNQLLDSREQTELLYRKLEALIQPQRNFAEEVEDTGDEELTRTLQELRHPMLPVQTHAIITLRQMLQRKQSSDAIRSHLPTVLEELKRCLENGDSYLYLAAIQTLGQLGVRFTAEVMPLLLEQYVNTEATNSLEERLKTGEVLRRIAHSIGDFAYNYAPTFIGHLRRAVRSPEPAMKISALAVLGEYCGEMRHGLHRHLVELNGMLDELATDSASTIEVKRAAVHFLRLLLQGRCRLLEGVEDVNEVAEQLRPLRPMVGTLGKYALVLDDVLQLHVQLAREELGRLFQRVVAPLTMDGGNDKRCLREKDLIKFL